MLSQKLLVNGLATYIPVSVHLIGSNLNVNTKPEKLRPVRDTIDI